MIVHYRDGERSVICSLEDDGSDMAEIYRGKISGGSRLLPFSDNRRILMGDCVLECPEGYTLDDCPADAGILVPIHFPEAFAKAENVTDVWTEVIIAPDNEHIAWTIRRSDCGAVNAMGRLSRTESAYEIEDACYISNMNAFTPDPDRPGYSVYSPEIGGEVKQFVQGGRAISLVGASPCGMGDSIVQDLATGEVTRVTLNPGYDETTIFSPDETLGMVMTTRFSKTTDMAVLGLVPRPCGQVLHNILGQVYMYGVTGVRKVREGNIGPALVDIERSASEEGYLGLDLSDPEGIWMYHSPMSWKSDGTSAMWMEREKGGNGVRIRIVRLLDRVPGEAQKPVPAPEPGGYAREPEGLGSYDVVVAGKVSGEVRIRKESGFAGKSTVTVSYSGYSDDGAVFWNGSETSSGSIFTRTTYESSLEATDPEGEVLGGMEAGLAMSAAYSIPNLFRGSMAPVLDTAKSSGTAFWGDARADTESLVP